MKRNLIGKTAVAAAFLVLAANFFIPLAGADDVSIDRWAAARLKAVQQNYLAHLRAGAVMAKGPADIKESGPASSWLTGVSAVEVNMVTNKRENKKQVAVALDGKTYYCPDGAYALNMSRNPSLRFAKDPLTDKRVDKADAVIYADASGKAYYFESEDTYRGFIGMADAGKGLAASWTGDRPVRRP